MKKRTFVTLLVATVSLSAASSARAAAPSDGLVFEGVSVPGLALGDTRAQAEAAYGEPLFCQSVTQGDLASCSFPVEGGGTVSVRYRGADGGPAGNSPEDVVHNIRWFEQVSGWYTTAGVNTALAAGDPDAVIAAYPDATITYNMFGGIYSVVDHEQGFEVIWALDFYTGRTHVNMSIFFPRSAPPAPEMLTRVTDIDLTVSKGRGRRQVRALAQVRDQNDLAAEGATVTATWVFPNGDMQQVIDVTSMSGYAYFEVQHARRGTHTLRIDDVALEGHRFDSENSVLEASVFVR